MFSVFLNHNLILMSDMTFNAFEIQLIYLGSV